MTGIIIAAAVVSIVGLILGLFLGFMGKKFAVEVDQKEIDVRAELPGNNCGGCGYAGCDALAKAIAAGEAEVGNLMDLKNVLFHAVLLSYILKTLQMNSVTNILFLV